MSIRLSLRETLPEGHSATFTAFSSFVTCKSVSFESSHLPRVNLKHLNTNGVANK